MVGKVPGYAWNEKKIDPIVLSRLRSALRTLPHVGQPQRIKTKNALLEHLIDLFHREWPLDLSFFGFLGSSTISVENRLGIWWYNRPKK